MPWACSLSSYGLFDHCGRLASSPLPDSGEPIARVSADGPMVGDLNHTCHLPRCTASGHLMRMEWMVGVPKRIRTYVAAGNRRSPGPLDDRDASTREEPSELAGSHSTRSKPIVHQRWRASSSSWRRGHYLAGSPQSTPRPFVPMYTLPKMRGSPVICSIQAYLCSASSMRCQVVPSSRER